MRVLFVNDNMSLGGVQSVNQTLQNKLKQNIKCEYFVYSNRKAYFKPKTKINIAKISIISRILRKFKHGDRVVQDANYLIDFLKESEFDVVVLQAEKILLAPFISKEFPNIKLVGWAHSSADAYYNQYFVRKIENFRESLRTLDQLICLTKEDSGIFSKDIAHCTIIPNPINIKNAESSSLKSKKISFTGRLLVETKGIDILIKLADLIPNEWTIEVAGDGNRKENKKIRNLLKKIDNHGKIKFVGRIEGDKLRDHYKESSIFISTSRIEGFGVVILEAMEYGLPIVSTPTSGSKEILNNGEFGFITSDFTEKEIADKLFMLINNYNLRKEYQEKSLKRVLEYDVNRISKLWISEVFS
ncbi:glycosyltransferase [Enterococcus lemanii]|uniref:Glycosyltransferase n=1 Tax=Enterococcus lemanii TaxID=1159752 RepID=A0ABV9MS85_9ENTE|nr:glycosyltransferase [Enterococcus lemanii]MBM7709267.1 glycosyltransferase involved in cell wall biosynthesis [Enterococcus lemanii]